MPDIDQLDPSLVLNDPSLSLSSTLTATPTANADLIPTPDGAYSRVVFTTDEYDRVCSFLSKSITRTLQDYESVWARRDRNKRAYEALPIKGEAITLPMCRSNTNQQHAWLVNKLFSKDPFMDCQALGDRKYTVIVRDPDTGVMSPQEVTATDEAKGIRDLINYKWTHRLPMRDVLSAWAMEALQDGNLPALVKVIHDDRYYAKKVGNRITKTVQQSSAPASSASALAPAPAPPTSDEESGEADGAPDETEPVTATATPVATAAPSVAPTTSEIQIINSPQFVKYQGETVRIVPVPGENFLKPFSSLSIEEAPWVSHFFEEPVYETHRKLSMGLRHQFGGYDFCLPDDTAPSADQIGAVLFGTTPVAEQPGKRASRSTKEASAQRETDPLATNVIHEVYFRWPILTSDESASTAPTIEWMELSGYYHHKAQKLLSCWLLPNWNGERPFVDWFMRPRPNSYSGTCTVEDIAPFQHYASHLFHLQVQNMVMRNVSVFFVRKGSATATSLRGRKLHPGMIVEFDDPDDVKNEPLGTAIDSIASEIQFLKAGAQEMSVQSQYDAGTADLARVAGAAFSQQQDLAKMQPQQIYDNWADAVSRLALKWLQFTIQYAPEQHIPQFSPISNAVIDAVLHLPREMIMKGDFAIYPVATPLDETKQMESQRDLQIAQAIDKANHFMLEMWGNIAKPGIPPPFVIMGMTAIARGEKILGELISHTRHDASEYVVPQKTLMGLIHQLYEMQQQLEQQQQQQQQMNAGGPVGPGGQPGQPGAPPPPGGPPSPAGPSPVKITLKGDLTPEQEVAAAGIVGVHGAPPPPDQQMQNGLPLPPQGAVSNVPPNTPQSAPPPAGPPGAAATVAAPVPQPARIPLPPPRRGGR